MSVQTFLILLFSWSVITGLITEVIKKFIDEKKNLVYNIVALVVAVIVGSVGTTIYYYLNDISFSSKNIIFIILLGLASGLVAELGYDKIKEAIIEITNKQ